ncbi:hypothetical protein [Methyloraptor flagellatus]|uniref:Uncharacterized protein n=1 Tax=Methyloraptor flagellatus TaxID=3162530 RepID=A0AAU7XC05_9HYPH
MSGARPRAGRRARVGGRAEIGERCGDLGLSFQRMLPRPAQRRLAEAGDVAGARGLAHAARRRGRVAGCDPAGEAGRVDAGAGEQQGKAAEKAGRGGERQHDPARRREIGALGLGRAVGARNGAAGEFRDLLLACDGVEPWNGDRRQGCRRAGFRADGPAPDDGRDRPLARQPARAFLRIGEGDQARIAQVGHRRQQIGRHAIGFQRHGAMRRLAGSEPGGILVERVGQPQRARRQPPGDGGRGTDRQRDRRRDDVVTHARSVRRQQRQAMGEGRDRQRPGLAREQRHHAIEAARVAAFDGGLGPFVAAELHPGEVGEGRLVEMFERHLHRIDAVDAQQDHFLREGGRRRAVDGHGQVRVAGGDEIGGFGAGGGSAGEKGQRQCRHREQGRDGPDP